MFSITSEEHDGKHERDNLCFKEDRWLIIENYMVSM